MDEKTDIGPLARADLLATLHDPVTESAETGATVLTGGELLDRSC